MKRLRMTIHGAVQGIGFRYSAFRKAQELGITGWVQNAPDGTVEVDAEGEEIVLQQFRDWCKQGPPLAGVEKIEETWEDSPIPSFSDFTIIR